MERWTYIVARWGYYINIVYKIQMQIQKEESIFRRLRRPRNTLCTWHLIIKPTLIALFLTFMQIKQLPTETPIYYILYINEIA